MSLLGFEPENAMHVGLWVSRTWPLLLVGGFMLLFRASLKNRLAFFVLGVLLCFGVQLIVGQFSLSLPLIASMGAGEPIQIMAAMLENLIRTVAVSLVLAHGPLWWLYRLLRAGRP